MRKLAAIAAIALALATAASATAGKTAFVGHNHGWGHSFSDGH